MRIAVERISTRALLEQICRDMGFEPSVDDTDDDLRMVLARFNRDPRMARMLPEMQ